MALRLFQRKDGFRYTSDTMFLYDFISSAAPKGRLLDAGSGCGILGLLLKRDFCIELTMIEKEPSMSELSKKNSIENALLCEVVNRDFLHYESEAKFDFIVSNPPFYDKNIQKSNDEKLQQARYGDAMPLKDFLAKAKRILQPHGSVIFCYDARFIVQTLAAVNVEKGLSLERLRFVYPKKGKPSKLALFHLKLGSKAHTVVEEPLYVFDGDAYTDEAAEIFKKADTLSVDIA